MLPLFLVGPTASGKTSLSLWLAQQLPQVLGNEIDILVVDSKQVYVGQTIVTGKDLGKNFKFQSSNFKQNSNTTSAEESSVESVVAYFTDGTTRIFGLDLVEPNQQWSVAHFLSYAQQVYEQSIAQKRQLLIVGGTPLYTLALLRTPETSVITPNQELREELGESSVQELQDRLKKLSLKRFKRMNPSDQRNPRRLVRAIEIEVARRFATGWLPRTATTPETFGSLLSIETTHWIGLSIDKESLERRIERRVEERIANGAVEEFALLYETYPDWTAEAKSALGYFDIQDYLTEGFATEELVARWTRHEIQYAKRQLTWWKREKQITWVDALDSQMKEKVLDLVKNWYTDRSEKLEV